MYNMDGKGFKQELTEKCHKVGVKTVLYSVIEKQTVLFPSRAM